MNLFEKNLLQYFQPGQLRDIQSKKIGIGGAGGLGSNIAVILTRCGFKNFEILDDDKIEYSNLNRQQYFFNEIGQKKTDAIHKRLLSINPDCAVDLWPVFWTAAQGNQFFNGCDFVVEAFDRVEFKHAFVSFYQNRAPFVVSGVGMAGLSEKNPLTVKKMQNIYLVGDFTTGTGPTHPPLAPRVTACAAIMAEIILELACGMTPRVEDGFLTASF
ncbi:MAG TPA: sulfur carrier protein ThiS adenylyltransferase ThiF [Candidatus Omnitrophota bacterium]|mgnify:CR=1 FL=1|nr:sulfur carrier protein ThiS adenylyltransferase ThiF [Candidatus Omnitrophota bacterium]HQO57766.1 sulfur carrier protein ThiS adenylyltransferase ThiF [Candidatus Omnitrophota bacterium]HQP11276.1 sulfur carrier protein ThiS adenylyltransferase ThiF [Candidatus Omnitrophota bacterium]